MRTPHPKAGFSFASDTNLTAAGALTINGTNGAELDGSFNTSSNLTVNANRITLNNGTFSGANSTVVLQALNSSATMLVNGSGASFGNVASVLIGGTSQAASSPPTIPKIHQGSASLTGLVSSDS